MRAAQPALDEEALERGLDVVGRTENPLDARTPLAADDDRELARPGAAERLAVELDRDARSEERFADELPPAPRKLDDDELGRARRGGSAGG
jgi:hypothetical protein